MLSNSSRANSIPLFYQRFKKEASKQGLARSNAFVLVEWGAILLQHCAEDRRTWDKYGNDLILSHAQILELCCASDSRQGIKQSALVATRRALRRIFRDEVKGEVAITSIVSHLTSKTQTLGVKSAVLLGVVAGVCARLPFRRPALESQKSHIYSFYVREIIGSRLKLPNHIVNSLADFFADFTTDDDLRTIVVPAIEKGLLRAPEVILDDLVTPLVKSLPLTVDLTQLLSEHLLKPLLSNIKSQNVAIRNGAMSAFTVIISRCNDQSYLERIADEIMLALSTSKLLTAEQRTLHARMLSLISLLPSPTEIICTSLAAIIAKEANEGALGAEALALTHQFSLLCDSGFEIGSKTSLSVIDVFCKGMSDKGAMSRRTWALRAGDLLWTLKDRVRGGPTETYVVETLAPRALEIFEEAVHNPQAAIQSGLATAACVFTALWKYLLGMVDDSVLKEAISKAKVFDRVVTANSKLSFLFNHRMYAKLSTNEEYVWMIRALVASSEYLAEIGAKMAASDTWAQAFLYLITANSVPSHIQKDAIAALTDTYNKHPAVIADVLVQGMWTWIRNTETGDQDTAAGAAKTGNTRLHIVIQSICPPSPKLHSRQNIDNQILQAQLVNMLVLCRSEILPRISWIEICLRVGQDPGTLVRAKAAQCLERVDYFLTINDGITFSTTIQLAAHNTAAELAFIAPDVITPLIIERIEHDLAAEQVNSYGPTDVAIARTPEGTAFVDVLDTKTMSYVLDKNSKDYDTMKWEEEVRNHLAQKKGQEKKLTTDEKAKVNAQLVKEANIRSKILEHEKVLRRGLGFIHSLATGPPIEADMWLGSCLNVLLDLITADAQLLVGDAANETYLTCSSLVSPRLGSLRKFVGVATLRALGLSKLSENLEQEPLGGMYTMPPGSSSRTDVF